MVFLLLSIFLTIFFSSFFMSNGYSTCSKIVSVFTNSIRIEEKIHKPVTVRFSDYAFNENIHMYCFHEWDISLIHLFYDRQKPKSTSVLSLEKKKLLLVRFSVKFVILPARSIMLANRFACVPACTTVIGQVSLTSLSLKAKFNKTIINFIIAAIVH